MSLSLKENMLMVYQHKTPEFIPLKQDLQQVRTTEPGFRSVVYEGATRGGSEEVDWFGQNWLLEPTINAYNPDAKNYIIKDVARWRDYVTIPDPDKLDWKALFSRHAIEHDKNKLLRGNDTFGLWERAFSMISISDLLCALIEEPEACEDFFSAIADYKIKLHNYFIDYYKPDVMCMHDDYGSGQGLFMSPDVWRELIKPSLKRVIDNVKSKGVMYEHHCCGYMAPLAEEIAGLGATSWNSIHVSNNPLECKQKFGERIALVGGMCNGQYLDTDSTTEEGLRRHVRQTAEAMLPGVGIVISCSFRNHPERAAVFDDELIRCGNLHYGFDRPQ